jgi:hypothetical protein
VTNEDADERRAAEAIRFHGARLIAEGAERQWVPAGVTHGGVRTNPAGIGTLVGGAVLAIAAVLAIRLLGPAAQSAGPLGSLPAETQTALATVPSGSVLLGVSPSPEAAPPCLMSDLRVSAVRQGENGVVNIETDFTNAGGLVCWLPNVPVKVSLVAADGKALPLLTRPPVASPGQPVSLQPSQTPTAALVVYWGNWCSSRPGPLSMVVTFSLLLGSISAPVEGTLLPRCDYSDQGSWIQIDSLVGG